MVVDESRENSNSSGGFIVDGDMDIDDPEDLLKEFVIEEFCWRGWGWGCKPKCEQKSHLLQYRVRCMREIFFFFFEM